MDVREKLVELLDDATVENIAYIRDGHAVSGCFTKLVKVGYAGVLADNLIANGVTVQQWISVRDRLPDKPGYYLTWWHGHSCPEGMIDVLNFDGTVFPWTTLWTAVKNEVTHWMPLPQPPKGE